MGKQKNINFPFSWILFIDISKWTIQKEDLERFFFDGRRRVALCYLQHLWDSLSNTSSYTVSGFLHGLTPAGRKGAFKITWIKQRSFKEGRGKAQVSSWSVESKKFKFNGIKETTADWARTAANPKGQQVDPLEVPLHLGDSLELTFALLIDDRLKFGWMIFLAHTNQRGLVPISPSFPPLN